MRLSDMHFHLDGYQNHKQIYNQINKLEQYTLCVTNPPDIFEACISTYNETPFVRFALGMHPLQKETSKIRDKFFALAKKTRYIGEIGLDFSKASAGEKARQIDLFEYCLNAVETEKIFSIHSLKAENQLYEILKNANILNKYIIHWYSGNMDILEKLIDIGCYFSINIKQVMKNCDMVLSIPQDKLLIESDGPIGSYIGKKYVPLDLSTLYRKVEMLLKIDCVSQINDNLRQLLT